MTDKPKKVAPPRDEKKVAHEYLDSMVRMKYIEEQAGAIQQQLILLERSIQEIDITRNTLGIMKKHGVTSDSLFPLGSGIFADGTLKKADKILMDVGAGVMVEKTIEEAIKFLNEREEILKRNFAEYQTVLGNMQQSYQEMGQRVQQLQRSAQ